MATRQRVSKGSSTTATPPVLKDVVADGELHEPLPEVRMPHSPISLAERERRIAVAAYLRAQDRGFAPGGELEDWLAAEREVDGMIATGKLDA